MEVNNVTKDVHSNVDAHPKEDKRRRFQDLSTGIDSDGVESFDFCSLTMRDPLLRKSSPDDKMLEELLGM